MRRDGDHRSIVAALAAVVGLGLLACGPPRAATTQPPAPDAEAAPPSHPAATQPSAGGTQSDGDEQGNPATLDKDEIRSVVHAHMADVKSCYDQGLATDPGLTGRVMFKFTIAPDGRVSVVAVTSSELPRSGEPVQECIRAAIATWSFPTSGGNVVVSYPFVLVPEDFVRSVSGLVSGAHPARVWFPLEDRPAHSAVVEVQDQLGKPVEGVLVQLTLATARGRKLVEGRTDAQGLAQFADLPSASSAHVITEGVKTDATPLRRTAMGVIVKIVRAL